jgi:hypothetical protein
VAFIALAVLPSALTLPQTNPARTLEYAPVPPSDRENVAPPGGNLASLGLAGGSTLLSGGGEASPPAAARVPGAGTRPSTKRCVGSPPRQTADPLAPPCVAYFDGDNFGATHVGVTRDEVRILIFAGGVGTGGASATCGTSRGCEPVPTGPVYYDLAKPPAPGDNEYVYTRYGRAWQRYFNDRYQTYNRFVHFFIYYTNGTGSPEARNAQAADNFQVVKPFAVVTTLGGNIGPYQDAMAQKGVLVFSSSFGLGADSYRKFPGYAWGYQPSLEQYAKTFSSYVCTKVAGHPVDYSGNPGENGKPRKYGLLYHAPATGVSISQRFKDIVKPELARCGVTFAVERTHPFTGVAVDGRAGPDYAAEAMAVFKQQAVTTVIWAMGFETNFSKAANAIEYRPEWLVAGDQFAEGVLNGQAQQQSVWDHAVAVTVIPKLEFKEVNKSCRDALFEVDQSSDEKTLDVAYACILYPGLRSLFIGVQVSGPRLTPASVDKGFHAIPPVRSTDPATPACFYEPNDYTCVKDAAVMRWDSKGSDEANGGTDGCYRMDDGGRRYFAGDWPPGSETSMRRPTDPCNGYIGNFNVAVPNPPS